MRGRSVGWSVEVDVYVTRRVHPPTQCGVLLGALAMRHAYDCGCKKAELLAIKDDERTHKLLKGFYRT